MTEERVLNAIAAEGLVPSQLSLAEHYRRNEQPEEISAALPA